MMPDEPEGLCYLPDCPADARWKVTDTSDERPRLACDEHLPRAVSRMIRRVDGPVVVAPLFVVQRADDLLGLVAVGANVYGLVGDPTAALVVDRMAADVRTVFEEALSLHEPGADEAADAIRRFVERGPSAALSATEPAQADPSDVIPFPDSWERYEGPES